MTRPAQPQPYPGDVGAEPVVRVSRFERVFEDPLGRPLSGDVYLRNQYDEPFPAEIVGGRLSLDLPAGSYSLVAVLRDPDGKAFYRNERFVL